MRSYAWTYRDQEAPEAERETLYEAYVAVDEARVGRRPAVMVAHTWAGISDHERAAADAFARDGYVGFALDLYGQGQRGGDPATNARLMTPLREDRAVLRRRMRAALAALRTLPEVDRDRVAAIGYCFGGLAVLDLARDGEALSGVVAIHGVYTPAPLPERPIRSKVLLLHGWDDPMATPKDVIALGQELDRCGADWQLHAFGGTVHAFTNPAAQDRAAGKQYSERATRRSRHAMDYFLRDCFQLESDTTR